MLKIQVISEKVTERKGNSKATGNPYRMRSQVVYVHTFDQEGNPAPFPEKLELMLDTEKRDGGGAIVKNDQPAFPPGEYTLHPSSVYIDRDGRLALMPRLTPLAKRAA